MLRLYSFVKCWGGLLTGSLLIIVGIILFPLPVPFGLPCMILGAILVMKSSFRAKRYIIRSGHHNSSLVRRFRGKKT